MKQLKDVLKENKTINFDNYSKHDYDCNIKNAIHSYVLGLTSGVNNELRDNKCISKNTIHLLDKAFTSKYAKEKKIDAYRVVDWSYMNNVYNITKENIDKYIGKTLVCKNYISTTVKKESVWGDFFDDDLQLHIISNKPMKYLDINGIFNKDEIDCYYQEEILLQRNLKFKIESYDTPNKKQNFYILNIKLL